MGGSFGVTTSNTYVSGHVDWSESSVNTANNTSVVTATMYLSRTNTGYTTYGTGTFNLVINGTTISSGSESYSITYNSNSVMVSGSVTVPHNSDGTKTITVSWSGSGNSAFTLNSGSGSATLSTIPRASTLASTLSWTAGTQNLAVSLTVHDSSFHHHVALQVQNTSGTWVTVADRTNLGSSTTIVFSVAENTTAYQQLAQNENRPAQIYVDTYDSSNNFIGETVATGTVYGAAIGKISFSNFNIGDAVSATVSPVYAGFTYTAIMTFGTFTHTWPITLPASGTTASLTMDTSSYTDSMYSQIPNANSGTGNVQITSQYNGVDVNNGLPSPQYNPNFGFTASVKAGTSNPTFGNTYGYEDINATTKAITNNNQAIIQNQSTVQVDFHNTDIASAINHATMSYYLATINSTSVRKDVPVVAPTLAEATNVSSTVAAVAHYVRFTWVDANGESLPSPEATHTMSGTGKNLVITLPTFPNGVTSAKVYVSTSSGTEKYQGSTTSTSYTLSAPPTTGGATCPTMMTFPLGKVNSSANTTLNIQAVDSRGNSTTTSVPITMIPYTIPVISTTALRENGFDSNTDITLSGTYSLLPVTTGGTTTNTNSLSLVQYAYKKTTDSVYTVPTPNFSYTTASGSYSATRVTAVLDQTQTWNVQITVQDKLTTSTVTVTVGKGIPAAFIDEGMNTFSVGQLPQNHNAIEVAGDYWSNGDPLMVTKTGTIPATAGWYRVATSAVGIFNNMAEFEIIAPLNSHHSTTKLIVSQNYANTGYSQYYSLSQLSHSYYGSPSSTAAVSQARIVYNTTYSGNYAYLEVYCPNASSFNLTVKLTNGTGWSLMAPTSGSIPSGYTSATITLYPGGYTSLGGIGIQSGTNGIQFLDPSGIMMDGYGNIKPRDTSAYASNGSWGVVNSSGQTMVNVPLGSSGGQVSINNGRKAVSSANGEWRLEIVTMNVASPGGTTTINNTMNFPTAFTTIPNVLFVMVTTTVGYVDEILEPFISGVTTTGFSCKFTCSQLSGVQNTFGSGTMVCNFLVFGK